MSRLPKGSKRSLYLHEIESAKLDTDKNPAAYHQFEYIPSGYLTWPWKITIFNRQIIYKWPIFHGYTQSGKSVHRPSETQITMGRRAFGKSEKSVQNHANQHGTPCASNHLFRLMFGVFYGCKIRNHIVDAASMQSLF